MKSSIYVDSSRALASFQANTPLTNRSHFFEAPLSCGSHKWWSPVSAFQTIHYGYSRLPLDGIKSNIVINIMDQLPTKEVVDACCFGETRTERDAGLMDYGCYVRTSTLVRFLKHCEKSRNTNPVMLKAFRQAVDQIIGHHPDTEHASQHIKMCLRHLHPDKTQHLCHGEDWETTRLRAARDELFFILMSMRSLLQTLCFGKAVYAPGRLQYGQCSARKVVAPCMLGVAVMGAVSFFLPIWAAVMVAVVVISSVGIGQNFRRPNWP